MDNIIRVKLTEQVIKVKFSSAIGPQGVPGEMGSQGPQGPEGETGPVDSHSHTHADPKATTRVITFVEEFKSYVIEDN